MKSFFRIRPLLISLVIIFTISVCRLCLLYIINYNSCPSCLTPPSPEVFSRLSRNDVLSSIVNLMTVMFPLVYLIIAKIYWKNNEMVLWTAIYTLFFEVIIILIYILLITIQIINYFYLS